MSKFKSCPTCASDNIDERFWASKTDAGPGCMTCGTSAMTVELWNTRPIEDALIAAIKEDKP